MEKPIQRGRPIIPQLENLVRKVQVQSSDFSELDFHVYLGDTRTGTFVIEISKGRLTKGVVVDPITVRQLEAGRLDANLSREVRNAMLAVARLAEDRE